MVKLPLGFAGRVGGEDLAKERSGFFALEEVGLIRCPVVAVARRNLHSVNAQLCEEIEKLMHLRRVGSLEDGGVGIDLEAFYFGGFDSADGFVENAATIDAFVMPLAHPVEMNHEGEIGRRREFIKGFFEQETVGAEIHVFFAIDQSSDNFTNLRVKQRFSAWNRDDRGTALVYRRKTLFRREVLLEDFGGMLDFAATRAGEVAAEERFQHQHKGKAFASSETLFD